MMLPGKGQLTLTASTNRQKPTEIPTSSSKKILPLACKNILLPPPSLSKNFTKKATKTNLNKPPKTYQKPTKNFIGLLSSVAIPSSWRHEGSDPPSGFDLGAEFVDLGKCLYDLRNRALE